MICFNDYLKSEKDYFNNINHFTKSIYYKVSLDVMSIINDEMKTSIAKKKSVLYYICSLICQKVIVPIRLYLAKIKRKINHLF